MGPPAKVPRTSHSVTFSDRVLVIPITYQCGGSCQYTTASKTTLASHVEANHRWSRALRPRCPPPVTTPSPTTTRTLPPTMTLPPATTTPPTMTLPPATTTTPTAAQPQVCPPPPAADLPSPQGATTSPVRAVRVATRPSTAKRKGAPDHVPPGGPCKRPRPRAKAPPGLPPLPLPPRHLASHRCPSP